MNRDFTVDDVTQKQTFIIKNRSFLPTIDPSVKVRVKGHLDGKALVYIPNGPWIIDAQYTLKLRQGPVNKELSRAFTYKQFSVVYQPITAKSGHLEIEVEAP
ncbi:hypothetical protein ACFQ4C_30180 [Larkinella insperata]|uniref:Uncharacterized protein n=1 Tax=Larkinella insperata TaxID=332158 RepID=A0ABW3QCB1_9BACT